MPTPRPAGARRLAPHGLVESVHPKVISGWVTVQVDAPPMSVELALNGRPIMSRPAIPDLAADPAGHVRRFQFNVVDLWQFTRPDDRIQVLADGAELPFAGGRLESSPPRSGDVALATLHQRLSEGYVFNSWGRLRLSKQVDTEWQRAVLDLYQRVDEHLQTKHRLEAFPIYGSLLGIVRENNFISHDYDFDCAYVSGEDRPRAVRNELQAIAFGLVDAGFRVVGRRPCIWVKDPDSGVKIDLFHLYWDDAGHLAFPFGVAGTSTFTRDQLGQLRTLPLGPGQVRVPEQAEALVEHLYGQDWRTPDPSFSWRTHRRRRAAEGLLSPSQVEEIYWTDFYANASFETASSFCNFVLGQPELPDVVVDIGCGDGRDSYAFARGGKVVVGLDRAAIGITHATRKAEELGHASTRFVTCDVSDAERLRSVLQQVRDDNDDRPMLLYTRFFLHAVPEETQHTLLSVIQEVAGEGDVLAAEFRTDRDERSPKVHGQHYRRFQNGPAFGTALQERYDFVVRIEQEGNGFSPYQGEDPYLYRVIAHRRSREEAAHAARSRRSSRPRPAGRPTAPPRSLTRKDRVIRTIAREYAPPALTRWVLQRRSRS